MSDGMAPNLRELDRARRYARALVEASIAAAKSAESAAAGGQGRGLRSELDHWRARSGVTLLAAAITSMREIAEA